MKNMMFIFVACLWNLSVFAATPSKIDARPTLEANVMIKTKSGQFRMDRVRKIGTDIFFNGMKLEPAEAKGLLSELKILGKVEKENDKNCETGFYKHKVVIQNKTRSEIGCLTSPHYKKLSKAIAKIRKSALN